MIYGMCFDGSVVRGRGDDGQPLHVGCELEESGQAGGVKDGEHLGTVCRLVPADEVEALGRRGRREAAQGGAERERHHQRAEKHLQEQEAGAQGPPPEGAEEANQASSRASMMRTREASTAG